MSNKQQNLTTSLSYMLTARAIDIIEKEYTARGEAFFHVSGGGHEGIAVINAFLKPEDWIHAHYRDKSLLLARGVTPYDYFLALFNKNQSHSRGRQMNAHMSSPENHILSLVGPVGNSHSQAAGIIAAIKDDPAKPIVLGMIGDGATNQGEFLEALTLSVRDNLPLITIVENNQYAISTFTEGKTFFQVGDKAIDNYIGCPIIRIDGKVPHLAYDIFEEVVTKTRESRSPCIVVFTVDRLDSHTNADDHKVYRSTEDIETIQSISDPLVSLIMHLYDLDEKAAKVRLDEELAKIMPELRKLVKEAQLTPEPQPIFTAKQALPSIIKEQASEKYEEGDGTMIVAIREVLDSWLAKDERVFLYGEDIEDPKGDVFGVTKGLSTAYPNRVENSPLSESLILGTSVGRALTGQIPVAFLQFADFLPLALNQIYSELGSMYWRSDGGWTVPVIVMATSGGYKPGLGPFHAATMEAMAAHVPGIDVYSPSNAADAAGLLNAAFMSGRPSIFFYPKNLLNTKTRNISVAAAKSHIIEPGKARIVESGSDITMVAYGNTVPLCEKAAASLRDSGKSAEIIDLRTISPLDHSTVIESVKKTNALIVVHEENGTMGVGAEVLARVSEALGSVRMSRVTRRDTFVPCNFPNQLEVLPSYKRILENMVEMLNGTIAWSADNEAEAGVVAIEAVGSSPSDETLTIVEWKVKSGDKIEAGDLIAEGEANKADVSIQANVSGIIKDLLLEEGDTVNIGDNIALVHTEEVIFKTVTRESSGIPSISWQAENLASSTSAVDVANAATQTVAQTTGDNTRKLATDVYVGHVSSVLGGKEIDNHMLSKLSPEWNSESILASTGINSRHWLRDDETLVSISAKSARQTLNKAGLKITDISGIICATGTHKYLTPSLAAMVQYELLQEEEDTDEKKSYSGYAYDVSAACSGFVFALDSAYNRIQVDPSEKILLITGEELSPHIDMKDYQTGPIFADAATSSIVSSEKIEGGARVARPLIKTIGEPAKSLVVPGIGYIHMDGIEVYKVAVDNLRQVAENICKTNNIDLASIDLIVPHQANLKIIKGVARRLKTDMEKFYVNIDVHGNTSSCTVPICLDELTQADKLKGKTVLVVVFGGGYTFGGTILQY